MHRRRILCHHAASTDTYHDWQSQRAFTNTYAAQDTFEAADNSIALRPLSSVIGQVPLFSEQANYCYIFRLNLEL